MKANVEPRLTESNQDASAPTANTKESWAAICRRLKAELGEATYSSWFLRLELTQIGGDVAYLSVPTKFLKMWIQTHYSARILAAVGGEYPEVKHIVVNVRSSTRAPVAAHAQPRLDQEEFHEAAAPFEAAHPARVRRTACRRVAFERYEDIGPHAERSGNAWRLAA